MYGTEPKKTTETKLDTGIDGVRKSYPKYKVQRVKNTNNKYRLTDSNGHSTTLTRGIKKNKNKTYSTKEAIQLAIKDKVKKKM